MRAALFIAVLVSAPVFAAGASDVTVILRPEVTVKRADVRLSDIAEVIAADAELRARMERQRLAAAPAVGSQRTIRREDVLRQLRVVDDRPRYVAQGSAATLVHRQSVNYSGERLTESAREHLALRLREQYPTLSRLEITPVATTTDLRLPSENARLRPRIVQTDILAKRVNVWVDVDVDGKPHASIPVWLSVRAFAPVLAMQRELGQRQPIVPSDVAVTEVDIAGVSGAVLTDVAALNGRRARVRLARGVPVRAQDLEINPSVVVDEMVTVRVIVGRVQITTKAIAQEQGYVGQMIEVRNPISAVNYRARVVGEKVVEVTEAEGSS